MSKITNDVLTHVWHTTLYSCTHMATVGVKGLIGNVQINTGVIWHFVLSLSYLVDNRKKLQFNTLLTAICIVSHTENSKNDKGYIT